jgi:hypothetical protein
MPPAPNFSADNAPRATRRGPIIALAVIFFLVTIFCGFNLFNGWKNRAAFNSTLRDALIVHHQLKKTALFFNELDAAVNGAIFKAVKHQFDEKHINYLSKRLTENPIDAKIFSDYDYREFGQQTMSRLVGYYVKWTALYALLADHIKKTRADAADLAEHQQTFKKIREGQYGITFNCKEGGKGAEGQITANVVQLGKPETNKDEKSVYPVVGDSGDPREFYSMPQGEPLAFCEDADKALIPLTDDAKSGLLIGPTNPKFQEYVSRLQNIGLYLKAVRDEQAGMLRRFDNLTSQEPVTFATTNPIAEYEEYLAKNK